MPPREPGSLLTLLIHVLLPQVGLKSLGSPLSLHWAVFLIRSYSIASIFPILGPFISERWPLPSLEKKKITHFPSLLSLLSEKQSCALLISYSGASHISHLDSQSPSLPVTKLPNRSPTAHPALNELPSPSLGNTHCLPSMWTVSYPPHAKFTFHQQHPYKSQIWQSLCLAVQKPSEAPSEESPCLTQIMQVQPCCNPTPQASIPASFHAVREHSITQGPQPSTCLTTGQVNPHALISPWSLQDASSNIITFDVFPHHLLPQKTQSH